MELASVPSEAMDPNAPGDKAYFKDLCWKIYWELWVGQFEWGNLEDFQALILTVRINVIIELRLLTLAVH